MRLLRKAAKYVVTDWQSSRSRLIAEVFAWACSVVSAVMFAVTAPHIPIVPIYSIFMSGCLAAGWAAYTRGSFGLLANYSFIFAIDAVGLGRTLLTGGQ